MIRLDKALVALQLCLTRAKAQDAIDEQRVFVNGICITKNSYLVDESMKIEIKQISHSFVSRSACKLFDVIKPFQLDINNRVVMDVGASTGGFSEVCLQQHAAYVYALDVGSDQLDPTLRNNPRLCNMEHINCRYLEPSMFDHPIDFCVCDVSFISITLLLPAILNCMIKKECVLLIKPQFEAGKASIGKHGIVKDQKVHVRVLQEMEAFFTSQNMYIHHLLPSSVIGRDGNQEYVVHLLDTNSNIRFDYKQIVKKAFEKR